VISIVDYGLGNVGAFLNMYKRMNIAARPVSDPDDLAAAERIVLPGVGAFDHAMELLEASGLRPVLERKACEEKVPIIGVCVGMQILADKSDEGSCAGLGWVPGTVRHFRSMPEAQSLPLPHMGWNDVQPSGEAGLFRGLEQEARFYFLHSFFFEAADPAEWAATAHYGAPFACAVRRENIWGVQFHPEKSHHFGAALLKNFAEI
jgi:imidazole glycerol-phosphate synthase subunit HisH